MSKWNAVLYDHKHEFVSKFGSSLVEILAPQKGETILDLGCGTGDLACEIAKLGANVIGTDASREMIQQARTKYPEIKFSVQDATHMKEQQQFDAVFSNAALHWIKQPGIVVQNVFHALKDNGRFVAEMGGNGNIASIVNAIKQSMEELNYPYNEDYFPWYFPTAEEYREILQIAGFQVNMMTLYERPTRLNGEDGIRNWLKMFSDNILQHLSFDEKNNVYQRCEKILKPQLYKENTWIADYFRLRFVAVK